MTVSNKMHKRILVFFCEKALKDFAWLRGCGAPGVCPFYRLGNDGY